MNSMILPGAASISGCTSSLPVGMTSTVGLLADLDRGNAGGQQRPQVNGPDAVPLRQNQLGDDDVLAHGADVLPRGYRLEDLHPAAFQLMDVLDHDHRVKAFGQGIAGINRHILLRRQDQGPCLAGADGFPEADGDAVHGRGVVKGRGASGENGLGGDPVQGVIDRDFLHRAGQQAAGLQPRPPEGQGLFEIFIVDVDVAFVVHNSA